MSKENGLLNPRACRARYEEALAAFAVPGQREYTATNGMLTVWAARAGMTEADVLADVHALGITDHDGVIKSGFASAVKRGIVRVDGEGAQGITHTRAKPPPQLRRKVVWSVKNPIRGTGTGTATDFVETFAAPGVHPFYVRETIGDMDTAQGGCADWVRELSPCLDWLGKPPAAQTAMYLRALFAPSDKVHVLDIANPPTGKPGVNIRPAAEWVELVERGGTPPGDGILPNPLTGEQGTTTTGKPSYIANSTIAEYPHAVIEFDDMPLPIQFAFWRGFILTSNLAPALVSVTRSGGKSLHALLHVGCKTAEQWDAVREQLAGFLLSDPEHRTAAGKDGAARETYPFRCDPQSMRVRQATRLAGVLRRDEKHKGALQELIYLNPRARAGNMWREPTAEPPPPIDPKGKPPCGVAHGLGMCGACECLRRCPFADPDAVPGTTMKGGESVK